MFFFVKGERVRFNFSKGWWNNQMKTLSKKFIVVLPTNGRLSGKAFELNEFDCVFQIISDVLFKCATDLGIDATTASTLSRHVCCNRNFFLGLLLVSVSGRRENSVEIVMVTDGPWRKDFAMQYLE